MHDSTSLSTLIFDPASGQYVPASTRALDRSLCADGNGIVVKIQAEPDAGVTVEIPLSGNAGNFFLALARGITITRKEFCIWVPRNKAVWYLQRGWKIGHEDCPAGHESNFVRILAQSPEEIRALLATLNVEDESCTFIAELGAHMLTFSAGWDNSYTHFYLLLYWLEGRELWPDGETCSRLRVYESLSRA